MSRKALLSCIAVIALLGIQLIQLNQGLLRGSDQAKVSAYFCPEDNCSQVVIGWIERANESIDLAMYSFTLDSIGEALMRAKERGVRVRVILEAERIDRYSEYGRLKAAGVEVRLDRNSYLMHNKFMVVDGRIVLTGSFNYTWSGDRKNDENLVVIVDDRIASSYESEFDEMWSGVFGR